MVYFLETRDGLSIKIGYTERVTRRVGQLGTLMPGLKLLACMEGDRAVESGLHGRFREWHEIGEWFRDSPELREFIAAVEKDGLGEKGIGMSEEPAVGAVKEEQAKEIDDTPEPRGRSLFTNGDIMVVMSLEDWEMLMLMFGQFIGLQSARDKRVAQYTGLLYRLIGRGGYMITGADGAIKRAKIVLSEIFSTRGVQGIVSSECWKKIGELLAEKEEY